MSKENVNRKGITPIIAIVLLLMMTVAAAGLAYEFIMNMSDKQTSAIDDQVNAQSDKMRTDLRILQVQKNSGNLNFIIKNMGSVVIAGINDTTTDYIVDGKINAITPSFSGDCNTKPTIEISETCTLTVTGETLPMVGTTKTFEFILKNGYKLSYGCNVASSTDDFC
ncbi:MAG: flagellin [DPANN group archaeon]|nr:flagellin [DPANN group archaeon]